MKKKLFLGAVLVVFMLLTISITSAVNIPSHKPKKEDSPLYQIRTKEALNEENNSFREKIKTNFIQNRVFIIPVFSNKDLSVGKQMAQKITSKTCKPWCLLLSQLTRCISCIPHACHLDSPNYNIPIRQELEQKYPTSPDSPLCTYWPSPGPCIIPP